MLACASPSPTRRACAQMFARRLTRAFFCHPLGRGKFQPKLFFAIVSGNAVGVGDVGGVMSAPPAWGPWAAGGLGPGAGKRGGGGEGPWAGGNSLTRFVFFDHLMSLKNARAVAPRASSRSLAALAFAELLRPRPWPRPSRH